MIQVLRFYIELNPDPPPCIPYYTIDGSFAAAGTFRRVFFYSVRNQCEITTTVAELYNMKDLGFIAQLPAG